MRFLLEKRKRRPLGAAFDFAAGCGADTVAAGIFVSRSFLILRQLPGETEGASFSVRCHPKGRVCLAEQAIALRNRLEHLDELG